MSCEKKTKAKCVCCGMEFKQEGHYTIYCPECRKLPAATRKSMRAKQQKKNLDEEAKAKAEFARKKRMRLGTFELKGKSLRRVDAEAKLFGMSYGQYTAACRCGTIEQILKHKGIVNPKKMLKELRVE